MSHRLDGFEPTPPSPVDRMRDTAENSLVLRVALLQKIFAEKN